MADEENVVSTLFMDRSYPVGNSDDVFSRRAAHVKIGNKLSEPIPVTDTNDVSTTPKIYNVAVATANTETSQTLSVGIKKFTIFVRGLATLKLSFTSGQSGTNYITVPAGSAYHADELKFSGTLYFQTTKDTQTVEITEWL